MEYRIGFAGKFYTLWEYKVSYRTNEKNVIFRRDEYTYVKNISFDKNVVTHLYPDAIVDEELKGHNHSWTREVRVVEYNKFHCGKYMGRLFDACTDYDYMMWFYNNCCSKDQKTYMLPLMKEQGYGILDAESGYLETPEKIEEVRNTEINKAKVITKLNAGIPFMVSMRRNLNGRGGYYVNDMDIYLEFPEYKEMWYEGFSYGFPLDAKGRGKRVKGKQMLIMKYTLAPENTEEDIKVIVNEWKFA